MTTKERIQAELEHLSEEEMADLLQLIQSRGENQQNRKLGLMSKLRQVQIDAPADFSANLDAYTNGEKSIGGSKDVH